MLQNSLAAESSVNLAVLSPTTPFRIAPSQLTLAPREKKVVKVIYAPLEEGMHNTKLYVVSVSGEIGYVNMQATCGSALSVTVANQSKEQSAVNFGPCDFDRLSLTKMIYLCNRDTQLDLPVLIGATTPEILLPEKHLTLAPGETRRLPVSLRLQLSGARSEKVYFNAANSPLKHLDIIASCSIPVLMPCLPHLLIGVEAVGTSISQIVPLINTTTITQRVRLQLPAETSFSASLSADQILRFQATNENTESMQNIMLNLPANGVCLVSVNFKPKDCGSRTTILKASIMLPKKANIGLLELRGVGIIDSYVQREKPLTAIRAWCSTSFAIDKIVDGPDQPIPGPSRTLPVFKFVSPEHLMILQATRQLDATYQQIDPAARFTVCCAYMENISEHEQQYHVIVSYPFVCDIPVDGILASGRTLEIPISVHKDAEAEYDLTTNTIMGRLTVIDETGSCKGLHCTLSAVSGNLLHTSLNTSTTLSWPTINICERVPRRLFLRNRSQFTLLCNAWIQMVNSNDDDIKVPAGMPDEAVMSKCPFTVSKVKASLSPWEVSSIEIVCLSTNAGSFKAKLWLEYAASEKPTSKFIMTPITLSVRAGIADLMISPDSLNFGEADSIRISKRNLLLQNKKGLDTDYLLHSRPPFAPENEGLQHILALNRDTITATFGPDIAKPYVSSFALLFDHFTKYMPITGFGGIPKVESSVGKFLLAVNNSADLESGTSAEALTHSIDFGIVNEGAPKSIAVKLSNCGRSDANIKSLSSISTNLRWQFSQHEETGKNPSIDAATGTWIDFDEVDYLAGEEGQLAQTQSTAAVSTVASSGRRYSAAPSLMSMLAQSNKSKTKIDAPAVSVNISTRQHFPLRLPPAQVLDIQLSMAGFAKVRPSTARCLHK